MKWFKFYGKDWLTDMKVMKMSIEDRLCFITLLCLADDDDNPGVIKDCNEEAVISLTHLYEDPYNGENEVTRARGFLKRLNDNKMITISKNNKVIILNFEKRQSKNLSGYERVKRYREKQKAITEAKDGIDNKDNSKITGMITPIRTEKNRIDKSRKDKKRKDKKKDVAEALSFFSLIKEYFINAYKKKFNEEPAISFGKEGKIVNSVSGLFKDVNKAYKLIDDFLVSNKGKEYGYTLSICFSANTINLWKAGELEKYISNKLD